ncbi:MAG: hypothetical protein ACXAC7_17060 [Candidatus Hodarchaeales archaeon]|jgi:hypothetical protein
MFTVKDSFTKHLIIIQNILLNYITRRWRNKAFRNKTTYSIFLILTILVSILVPLFPNLVKTNDKEKESLRNSKFPKVKNMESLGEKKIGKMNENQNPLKNLFKIPNNDSNIDLDSSRHLETTNYQNQEKTDFSGSGSSTLIKANETFVTKKNDVYFNTSNDFGSIPRNNSQDLPFLDNNYENITGSFDLENITATIDHAVIEDDHASRTSAPSQLTAFPTAAFKAIATSFEVNDLSVNLTRVHLSLASGGGAPSGEIYITGVSGSTPEPNATIFGDKINIGGISGACQLGCSFNFDNPVTLTPGTYAIVMLDTAATHDGFDFYNWYFVEDSNNINNSVMWKYSWSGTWGAYSPASDLLFEYEFIRLNDSDTSQRLVYDSPLEVNLTYNGSLTDNMLLLNSSTAFFSSNVSVVFNFTYSVLYAKVSNPFSASTEYFIANNSLGIWNVSASQTSAPSGSFT